MKEIKCFKIFSILFFSSLVSIGLFLTPLHAADTELKYNDTLYLCTGVGESRDDPRWKEYPLKLMFTGSGRAYISEVKIELKDASGQTVLSTECDGPWLLAKLKAGKYAVQATAEGSTKNVSVTVPASGQASLAIRFPHILEGR